MPWFSYKAVSAAGEVIEGELEAPDRSVVVERLRSQGHVPIRAEEMRGGLGGGLLTRRAPTAGGGTVRVSGRGRVARKQIVFLTRELAVLLDSGLELERALSILAGLTDSPAIQGVLERILERVRGGSSLADAMEAEGSVFPNFYSGMVRAGEAGGQLDVVLGRLADTMERAQALKENVTSALIYPAIVVLLAIAVLAIMMTSVLPSFRPMFEQAGAALPMLPRVMLGLSDVVRAVWWAPVIGFAVLILILNRVRATPAGRRRWDHWLLGLPLFGDLVLKLEVARLSRTLGTLLANGVSVLNAFTMTVGATQNQAVAEALSELRGRLAKGEGIGRPLAELGLFPRLAVQLIEIGEETGRLEQMLLRVAEIYDEEVKRTIGRILALLLPLILVVLGVIIAVIIGSLLSAILSAYDLPF